MPKAAALVLPLLPAFQIELQLKTGYSERTIRYALEFLSKAELISEKRDWTDARKKIYGRKEKNGK